MTWEGYRITGKNEFGNTVSETKAMRPENAAEAAVRMRMKGLMVSVWPDLKPDIRKQIVEYLKAHCKE